MTRKKKSKTNIVNYIHIIAILLYLVAAIMTFVTKTFPFNQYVGGFAVFFTVLGLILNGVYK